MATQTGNPNLGVHLRGRQFRSSHLGYDLYTSGPLEASWVTCKLRRHRLSTQLAADIKDMLPSEFKWPTASHTEAKLIIDALLLVDLITLKSAIRQFPDHHFGFEQYLERGARWRQAASRSGSATLPDVRATDGPRGALDRPPTRQSAAAPIFPGWVKRVVPMDPLNTDHVLIELAMVYFTDGSPALRADAYPHGIEPSKRTLLSRIYIDLLDGRHQVIEHRPGRYAAFGLHPRLLQALLGVTGLSSRRTIWDHPDVLAADQRRRLREDEAPEALRTRAKRILAESRSLSIAADPDGDPEQVFGAHLRPQGAAR